MIMNEIKTIKLNDEVKIKNRLNGSIWESRKKNENKTSCKQLSFVIA